MEYFFEQISKNNLSPEHISLIETAGMYDTEEDKTKVFRAIHDEDAQVWVYSDDEGSYGVLVTAIWENPDSSRDYCLWRIAGSGLLKNLSKIIPRLESVAKDNSCGKITLLTVRPFMVSLLHEDSEWFPYLLQREDGVSFMSRSVE